MTYYTVNDKTNQIMETSDTCPDPQAEANFFEVAVYIIQGQHTGLTAEPKERAVSAFEKRSAVDMKKLAAWVRK